MCKTLNDVTLVAHVLLISSIFLIIQNIYVICVVYHDTSYSKLP